MENLTSEKNEKKWSARKIFFPGVVAIIIGIAVFMVRSKNNSSPLSTPTNTPFTTDSTAKGLVFANQPYFSSSVLISSDPLSVQAQQVLTGFKLSKSSLPDGSTQYNLQALDPSYHDQNYVLKPGEQLYFIDRFMGDEQANELNVQDDFGIVVDSHGLVIQAPAGLQ